MLNPIAMLLFQKRFLDGLVSGQVTLTFRRWDKPHVKAGGRYRCHPIGVLEVTGLDRVRLADISESDAKKSGFASRADLLEYIRTGPGGDADDDTELFRVELHHAGDGDRVEIALEDKLSPDDVETIRKKLERMDKDQPWTAETFGLIDRYPRIAASQLAKKVGRETLPFKVDVRKLKKLGLTQSFEVGYEISPRGRAYLKAVKGVKAVKAVSARPRRDKSSSPPPRTKSQTAKKRAPARGENRAAPARGAKSKKSPRK